MDHLEQSSSVFVVIYGELVRLSSRHKDISIYENSETKVIDTIGFEGGNFRLEGDQILFQSCIGDRKIKRVYKLADEGLVPKLLQEMQFASNRVAAYHIHLDKYDSIRGWRG